MSDTQTRDRLLALARRFANSLEAGNADAERAMRAVWLDAYDQARSRLDVLLALVAKARAEGTEVDRAWLVRVGRMEDVIRVARIELRRYAMAAANAATLQQSVALASGADEAVDLIRTALTQAPTYAAAVQGVNPANLATVVGLLADGSPLAQHLVRTVADDAADVLRDTLTRGIVQGRSPARLVEDFTDRLALSHTRATTLMRTESLRVYRETSRQTYAANPSVIQSWSWVSALDRRTCPACAAMHGTRHPVTEALDGHPRCRCAMVPDTVSYADLGLTGLDDPAPIPSGLDWMRAMSDTDLRTYLGPLKFRAYRAGEFDLPDLVARQDDPRWGTMRTERSMVSIRAGRHANYGGV